MIILLVILAIIAIAGFVITTALRKGLDPQDAYDRDRLKLLSVIRIGIMIGCASLVWLAKEASFT